MLFNKITIYMVEKVILFILNIVHTKTIFLMF
jgi:hypothetical protein